MEDNKIAVLIDGENISQNDIEYIFTEIKKDGLILISRLYCGLASLPSWKEACNEYSIKIITQNNYVTGKNTTDSSLIIDAMDILYTRAVNTFYILSSDSDFTGIIMRLREGDKKVIGVGEKKTPKAFVKACNKFIFIENLRPVVIDNSKSHDNDKKTAVTNLDNIKKEILDIVGDGRIRVSQLKEKLINLHPEFDLKNYGRTRKFSKFLEEIPSISLTNDGHKTEWFAEIKDNQPNNHNEDGNNVSNAITPLEDIKDYIVEQIKKSDENKINIGQLHSILKKEFKGFSVRKYHIKKFKKFLALFGETFKYEDDDPNYLVINEENN